MNEMGVYMDMRNEIFACTIAGAWIRFFMPNTRPF